MAAMKVSVLFFLVLLAGACCVSSSNADGVPRFRRLDETTTLPIATTTATPSTFTTTPTTTTPTITTTISTSTSHTGTSTTSSTSTSTTSSSTQTSTTTPTTTITTTTSTTSTEQPIPVFDVSANPTSITVYPGSAFSINVLWTLDHAVQPPAFCWRVESIPAGVTAILSPGCGVGTTVSHLALNVGKDTVPGSYQIVVTSNLQTPRLSGRATISLTVLSVLSVSLSSTSITATRGQLLDFVVSVNQNGGSSTYIFEVTGLPASVTGIFAAGVASGNAVTTLQLDIGGGAVSGTYNLVVTVMLYGGSVNTVAPAQLTLTIA